jgi:hypothetical protein
VSAVTPTRQYGRVPSRSLLSSEDNFQHPLIAHRRLRFWWNRHYRQPGKSRHAAHNRRADWFLEENSARRHPATLLAHSLYRVREKRTMREENFVPCLVLIVFLAFPRIALVLLFLFSNYLQRAYHGLLLPLLGFLFLPLTTLAYAWMINTRQPIAGINLVILIVAVVVDLGGLSRGEYHRRRRWED